ncbi:MULTISPECIES: siderophore-interacting protein [Gordonia]|uniref:Siderophore-interacting protein n=2 Tax=Gordonia TaxID=2053 RepID=A0ABN3HEN9_9ACTN|nr:MULTISPECIES: siderophore-interacting protein [Gordonia]AUH69693.1 siderophore-interacting protein [Gordonia sp. YC-JH1]WFN93737.1 siderophore-interacting protein [Gordonia sihwensis]GAC62137.1 putative siderophore-interacting protein [Gordonia sihwensis NBRC 108236]
MPVAETTPLPPLCVTRAAVGAVQRLSPNFVRITFTGAGLTGFGNPGATFDQRMKLIFPPAAGELPELSDSDTWYQDWLAIPEDRRGAMRTYSIRDLRIDDGGATEFDVDFVLHLAPDKTGPASSWAAAAAVGDELLIVGPRRGRLDGGGVEYMPGAAERVLLAGDETAAPAIARILEDAPADLAGAAYIEIPEPDDALPIDAPEGVAVHWLPREGAGQGVRLHAAVLGHLGESAGDLDGAVDAPDTDALVWETPTFSGLGEEIHAGSGHDGTGHDETGRDGRAAQAYYWIAGESRVVTTLRRRLVKDLGIPRAQVAFMGYWREGVAMKG